MAAKRGFTRTPPSGRAQQVLGATQKQRISATVSKIAGSGSRHIAVHNMKGRGPVNVIERVDAYSKSI